MNPTDAELEAVARLFAVGDFAGAYRLQDQYRRQYGYKTWDSAYTAFATPRRLATLDEE